MLDPFISSKHLLPSTYSLTVVLTFLGFDKLWEAVDLKSISSVKFLGLVWVLLADYLRRNFCIFPLNLDGESTALPIKLTANLLERVFLNFSDARLA